MHRQHGTDSGLIPIAATVCVLVCLCVCGEGGVEGVKERGGVDIARPHDPLPRVDFQSRCAQTEPVPLGANYL
jgi:hypothetical protein